MVEIWRALKALAMRILDLADAQPERRQLLPVDVERDRPGSGS
jgi:hypothetical protein